MNTIIKGKNQTIYYKAIIDYKIKKNIFRYIQDLKRIENNYYESSKLLCEAFALNPQLQILVTIKLNIKRMKRIHKKIDSLDSTVKQDQRAIAELKKSLNEVSNLIEWHEFKSQFNISLIEMYCNGV